MKPYKYSPELRFLHKFFEEREAITNLAGKVTNQDSTGEEEKRSEGSSPENEDEEQDYTVIECSPYSMCSTEVTAAPMTEEAQSQNASKSKSTGSKSIPQKKTKLSNDPTPKTAAPTITEYIVNRNENTSFPPPPQDPVDAFLAGIAPALKKLPPIEWYYAKGEIFEIVQKYEFQLITNGLTSNEKTYSSACSTPSQSSGQ